jgi:predicted CoA-substrate-specific enzyme activase
MKIPVFCSLLPAELFLSLGHEVSFITADMLSSARSREYHCSFHENLCSYSKSLYEYFALHHNDFDLIIIPTSCDAMKKLFNALSSDIPPEKLYSLDVPKNKGDCAADYLATRLEKLIKRIGVNLTNVLMGIASSPSSPRNDDKVKIGILGANIPMNVFDLCLNKYGFEAVYLNHCLVKSYPEKELEEKAADIKNYSRLFLDKNKCPRTNDNEYKEQLKKRIREEGITGLIINTLKFCDFWPFDYRYFKENLDLPILLIEHEFTASYEGQIMTRLEAFFEGIRAKFCDPPSPNPTPRVRRESEGVTMTRKDYFVGIDSGSHATKLVCINKDRKVVGRYLVPTGTSVRESVQGVLRLLAEDGISRENIARLVATGYGRNNVDGADEIVTEITCHAAGAYHLLGRGGTIIDIGGQDSKAIKIDETGRVIQFSMNDKCAAGTGRFLEVMADKLRLSLDEFAEMAKGSEEAVPVSSMCSVFAESEVISLIAGGKSKEEIAKGIHRAIAERTASLAKRINGTPPYYMAGGVSKNECLVCELESCLGSKIDVVEEPQFTGALGAALIALKGRQNAC